MTNPERIQRIERVIYDLCKYATKDCPWQPWSDSLYQFIKDLEDEAISECEAPE